MFDAGSPIPGLLLAAMLLLTVLLLPYTDDSRARTRSRDDEQPTEELRLRAEAIARTRAGQRKASRKS